MRGRRQIVATVAVALLAAAALPGCASGEKAAPGEVVIYTSVDQVYAEPVLDDFEAETGIRVRAVYDAEAAKTTALVNRLVAEKARPRADVWWSGEIVQTLSLAEKGVLAEYRSRAAQDIPEAFVDDAGMWTGFGGRARVLLVNQKAEVPAPEHVADLTDPEGQWDMERVGIADPRFGTSSTHMAVLYAKDGRDRGRTFYETVVDRGVTVLDGNGAVRDAVASGRLDWGLTDTDDALGSIGRGDPVRIVVPDQGEGDPGALLIPNTVALVAGGPDSDAGRAFIDWLLRPETEQRLVEDGWLQFPVRGEPDERLGGSARFMEVDYEAAYGELDAALADAAEIFGR